MSIRPGRESIDKGLVVCKDVKISPLQKISEMFDGEVYGQEFTIERAIPNLSRFQGLGEEGQRTPLTVDMLLKHRSNSNIGGIRHD